MIRLLLLTNILLIMGCQPGLQSQKIRKNNTDMLYGETSRDQIYFDYPFWLEIEKQYQPNKDVLDKINSIDTKVEVIVFLGTWCGDSRRNVPRFFKTIENNDHIRMKIWAVDRRKELDNDLVDMYRIKRVPTFVFLKDNQEIGRIIENPVKSIEEDTYNILNSIQ